MKLKPEQKASLRRLVTHTLLIGFLILVLVPYIMVVSASFAGQLCAQRFASGPF